MLKDFSSEVFDIVVQAGQSNAEGYGVGSIPDPCERDENVWALEWDMTMSVAGEKVNGNEIQSNFAIPFAREYISSGRLEKGRKLLILRSAVGSTGFLSGHWRVGDDLYIHMLEMIGTAMGLNPANRTVALLWHQGETEASLKASYRTHYDNLMNLVNGVRRFVGNTDLPFIAADFVYQWKNENAEDCAPVVKAIRDVCADCGHGGFIETGDLLSNYQELGHATLGWEDTIHFSRKSIYELGRRYFRKLEEITAKDS